MCVHVHTITCMEDHSLFFASITLLLGIKFRISFFSFSSKHLYLLSHLTSPYSI